MQLAHDGGHKEPPAVDDLEAFMSEALEPGQVALAWDERLMRYVSFIKPMTFAPMIVTLATTPGLRRALIGLAGAVLALPLTFDGGVD